MKRYQDRFIVIVFLLMTFSCAKTPLYKSQQISVNKQETFSNPLSAHYDKNSNTSFQLANNDTFLYVQAVFHSQESLMKIMRGGLILNFDPEGKKNSYYQLKVERSEKSQSEIYGLGQQNKSQNIGSERNLPMMIGMTFNKVTWNKNGKEFVFYRNILKEPIGVDFGPNEQNELAFNLKIPLTEIPFSMNQKIFSMGIETGKTSLNNREGQRPAGNMQGGGSGQRGNGGGGGRGGMGGGMHSGSGGGMSQGGSYPSGMSPLEFWVQVQLN